MESDAKDFQNTHQYENIEKEVQRTQKYENTETAAQPTTQYENITTVAQRIHQYENKGIASQSTPRNENSVKDVQSANSFKNSKKDPQNTQEYENIIKHTQPSTQYENIIKHTQPSTQYENIIKHTQPSTQYENTDIKEQHQYEITTEIAESTYTPKSVQITNPVFEDVINDPESTHYYEKDAQRTHQNIPQYVNVKLNPEDDTSKFDSESYTTRYAMPPHSTSTQTRETDGLLLEDPNEQVTISKENGNTIFSSTSNVDSDDDTNTDVGRSQDTIVFDETLEKNASDETALHKILKRAIELGSFDAVTSYIASGANVNYQYVNECNKTPLYLAAESNQPTCMNLLAKKGAKLECRESEKGNTALHKASKNGYTVCVSVLLDHKANVDSINYDHWTPLHVSSYEGHNECTLLLLDANANLRARTKKHGSTPLHLAALKGNEKCLEILLDYGSNVEIRDKTSLNTALQLAAENGHIKCVRWLLKFGADKYNKNRSGLTALQLAETFHHERCIRILQYKNSTEKDIREHGLPKEIRAMGSRSAAKLQSMMKDGWYRSYEARYIIVGEKGVGKTTLTKILVGDKTALLCQPTEGIELYVAKSCIDVENESWCCNEDAITMEDIVYHRMLEYTNPGVDTVYSFEKNRSLRTSTNEMHNNPEKNLETSNKYESMSPDSLCKGETIKSNFTKEKLLKRAVKASKKKLHKIKKAPVSIWDFGGEDDFYPTHQTFLSERGIYTIVINGSRGLDEIIGGDASVSPGRRKRSTTRQYLTYWVKSILTYSTHRRNGFPKIVILATHSDKVEEGTRQKVKEELFTEIKHMFKDQDAIDHLVIEDQFFLDLTNIDEINLNVIRSTLVDLAVSQPFWGERMPKRFLQLEMEMILSTQKGYNVMSLTHLKQINERNPIEPLNGDEIQLFLHQLQALGKIIHLPVPALNELIILNPTFLIDAFSSIITAEVYYKNDHNRMLNWANLKENGVLRRSVIHDLWSTPKFSKFEKYEDRLINLMLQMDFIAEPCIYVNGERIPAEYYLVPCMLSDKLEIPWPEEDFDKRAVVASFLFKESFLPPAVSFRFLTSCINLWAVAHTDGKAMLSSSFLLLLIDNSHQLAVQCQEGRITISLIHNNSKHHITEGLPVKLLENLKNILGGICQLYTSVPDTSFDEHYYNHLFDIELACSLQPPCFASITDIRSCNTDWECPNHAKDHKVSTMLKWCPLSDEETCKDNCLGIENQEFLNLEVRDEHLFALSSQLKEEEVKVILFYLGMSNIEWSEKMPVLRFQPEMKKLYAMLYWKDKNRRILFSAVKNAIIDMNIDHDVHILCKVTREKALNLDVENLLLQKVPTDQDLDKAAGLIGQKSLEVAISLGLSFTDFKNIAYDHPKNLPQLNRAILEEWKLTSKIKPTLEMLAKAISVADMCPEVLFEV